MLILELGSPPNPRTSRLTGPTMKIPQKKVRAIFEPQTAKKRLGLQKGQNPKKSTQKFAFLLSSKPTSDTAPNRSQTLSMILGQNKKYKNAGFHNGKYFFFAGYFCLFFRRVEKTALLTPEGPNLAPVTFFWVRVGILFLIFFNLQNLSFLVGIGLWG